MTMTTAEWLPNARSFAPMRLHRYAMQPKNGIPKDMMRKKQGENDF